MIEPLEHLRSHEIFGVAKFSKSSSGLTHLDISSPIASARIYLQGAHVASFQEQGEAPLLFMSAESYFAPGKAIRGGVPVIFPWFGPRADDAASPPHGLVRTREWDVQSVTQSEDESIRAVFTFTSTDETRAIWPFEFRLRYEVEVGSELRMTLAVENRSAVPFSFEEALHTYLTISNIHDVAVSGLAGVEYIDKVDGLKRKNQEDPLVTFTGETDRVYLNTRSACSAEDKGLHRVLKVEKSGSDTTVVWNPWIAKAASLPDFGNTEWPNMLCIETANAAENKVLLDAGGTHTMSTVVSCQPL